MITEPHPDEISDYRALKEVTTGGTQSADDQAMEAFYDALSEGKSKDEAGEIFIKTYQKFVYGMDKRNR